MFGFGKRLFPKYAKICVCRYENHYKNQCALIQGIFNRNTTRTAHQKTIEK